MGVQYCDYLIFQLPGKVPIDGYKSYLSHNLDLVKDCIVNTIFQNFVVVS